MNRQQMLEKVENLSAYEVKDHRFIEEMNSEGIVLEHRKSGTRLFLMSNDDDNKVFSIGSSKTTRKSLTVRLNLMRLSLYVKCNRKRKRDVRQRFTQIQKKLCKGWNSAGDS